MKKDKEEFRIINNQHIKMKIKLINHKIINIKIKIIYKISKIMIIIANTSFKITFFKQIKLLTIIKILILKKWQIKL